MRLLLRTEVGRGCCLRMFSWQCLSGSGHCREIQEGIWWTWCVMIKWHSRLEALVGITAGWTSGFDFGFMFLSYMFFLHNFPTGVHWYALKMFFYLHKHTYVLFHWQLHGECKVLFQIKLLSFKSFSSVIFSLISVVENAASNVIYMALPRL